MAQRSPKLHPVWQGVRFRRTSAAADPDAPPRPVILPAAWEDEAAAALAALVPGDGAVHLALAAAAWITPALRACAGVIGREAAEALGARLHARLQTRRAAPTVALWRGEGEGEPGFVFNLAAFLDPAQGFAAEAFTAAVEEAVLVLSALAPEANRLALGFADLAGLLAALGLEYGTEAAELTALALAALLRLAAERASARHGPRFSRPLRHPLPPLPALPDPGRLPPALGPELAAVLRRLEAERGGMLAHERLIALGPPGPVEALLGAEAGGFAPAWGFLDGRGRPRRALRALLAARGLDAETALARTLAGSPPFTAPSAAALHALAERLAPWLGPLPLPPLPAAAGAAETPSSGEGARLLPLPPRRQGYTQKVQIGGHPLFLRTGEYPDGRLGEIALSAPREAPAVRALLEGLAEAVSIGLQHGVPLAAYVEAFAHSRFGPHGTVEGDPRITAAASFLDYAFRHLAATYLGEEIPATAETGTETGETRPPIPPLLPLDLPQDPAPRPRRRLKVVA